MGIAGDQWGSLAFRTSKLLILLGFAELLTRSGSRLVFPSVGRTNAARIAGADLLAVLRGIESGGTFEPTHRVRSICSRVLRYARIAEWQCRDVAADLIGLLVPAEAEPIAAISTVVRRAADWMDAAYLVLLGFFI